MSTARAAASTPRATCRSYCSTRSIISTASSPPSAPSTASRSAGVGPHVDQRRIGALRRRRALLRHRRTLGLVERLDAHRPPLVDAAIDGADDAHVGEPFEPRRLRILALQDALGEVVDLDADLIARLELLALRLLLTDGELVLERALVLVRGVDADLAFFADDLVEARRRGAVADGERGQLLVGK